MNINELKVVVLVQGVIVAVHRHHIHPVADHMVVVVAVVMVMDQIWVCHHHRLVCSIQRQVG